MVETVTVVISIAMPLLGLVLTKFWDPIAEALGYPFQIRHCVDDLREAVYRVEAIHNELVYLCPLPRRTEYCKTWFSRARDLIEEKDRISLDYGSSGWNFFRKYGLGMQARRKTKRVPGLVEEGKDLLLRARQNPLPVSALQPQYPRERLWGVEHYKVKVTDLIINKREAPLLAITGMAGVGKSTLLKTLCESVTVHDFFEELIFVRAGIKPTIHELQQYIGTYLGIHLPDDHISRKSAIFTRLVDTSFLLILDDVWESIDFVSVGIPVSLGEVMVQPEYGITKTALRKVVFATRDESICKTWGGHSTYITRMECLNGQDAFELFTHHAGNIIMKDQRICQLAHEIVEECSGLPIALRKIGEAMSPKTEVDEWRGALQLLKTSNLDGVSDGYEDVFQQLKISFDQKGKELQNRFLICCLWPENENIPVEKLTEWWMGLGLIAASDRAITGKRTICNLLSSSLLEKGDTGIFCAETSHVKMHKMFHKMAQWVVNNQGEDKQWLPLSLCERSTLPGAEWCSIEKAWVSQLEIGRWENNRTILSSRSSSGPPPLTMLISSHAFSLDLIVGCQNIKFLDLEGTGISEFPCAICSLRELQYLNLSGTRIKELPQEMRRLSKLKFLLVRDAWALQMVAKELIRSLIDLVMVDLFRSSGFSTHLEYMASLLAELATPGIELAVGLTVQSMTHLSELGKLKWVRTEALCLHHFEEKSKFVDLHLLVNLRSLRELTIRNTSENLEILIAEHGTCLFHSLNFLELNNLRKLKEINWRNAGNEITVVNIYHCDKLKEITWVCELHRLEQLTVTYCQEMEELFSTSKLPPDQVVTGFRQIRRLYLENLPNLSIFFEKAMELDELAYVCITGCAKLMPLNVSKASDNKIRLECDKDWWHGLGAGRTIMSCFKPFCCWEKVEDEEI